MPKTLSNLPKTKKNHKINVKKITEIPTSLEDISFSLTYPYSLLNTVR